MQYAKRVTKDNGKNPEYHVVAVMRKLQTDKNCPAEKSWPNCVVHVSVMAGHFSAMSYEQFSGVSQ